MIVVISVISASHTLYPLPLSKCPTEQEAHIFLASPVAATMLTEALLVACHRPCQFYLQLNSGLQFHPVCPGGIPTFLLDCSFLLPSGMFTSACLLFVLTKS